MVYGDSITKALGLAEDALDVYREFFEVAAMGIHGDKTGELLWRVMQGEFNTETMSPNFVSILIGTNDLRKVSNTNDENGVPVSPQAHT